MADITPPRRILTPDRIDDVAKAVLALARELWVLRDRQIVTEAVLATRGIDIRAEVDRFQPDPALQAGLDRERDRIIAAVAAALGG
ncbi:hypothetical protein SAMN05444678_10669 [Sphingomonas sp. YR710]|jgi:hypothetical protein|uniref:hypothetical protein n=1 Tax=Sphingomonas sp. YR710 TaxID=1882773 RepID=UPI000883F939|nr:hypothetical protein [Sphingomonas sp. YR710]SDC83790.1 hypothetical protein SAMN05444678_10669 [Sphingomonas sp. YR710]